MKHVTAFFLIGVLVISLASFRNVSIRQKPLGTSSVMSAADTVKIDAESGMINDPNLMMVKAQCTACHSSKLILQHRFTRAGWQERIRWMQKYHKLWDLGESEKVVLDYLEKYYGPENAANINTFRRQPLKDVQWYRLPQ
ncbi:hypothetical protein [Spirosoma radiotolerans]|uniref:Monoheme cytochrome C n=1 Tax=Spirosoma radiotolerans TaxID=1379870 RepID=A0A0E3V959_9BACT|nr:hypothetical protein [Spirosoma radiotolerans]AKD56856.1 hypothetical protein SD10_20055 [Spirosoma radiotolerans]